MATLRAPQEESSTSRKIDRSPYEFSQTIKIEALKRANFKCEICNRSKKDLQRDGEEPYFHLHHILAIAVAIKLFPWIGKEIVKSIENCLCVCEKCHKKIHASRQDHEELAETLLQKFEQRNIRVEKSKMLLGSGGRRRI